MRQKLRFIRSRLAPIVGLAILLGFLFFKLATPSSVKPVFSLESGNIASLRDYFSSQIDRVGATQAYAIFKEETRGQSITSLHPLAHLFGEILYQKAGLEGITVCDNDFAFGCYHSFFGSAIAREGSSIIAGLHEACVKKFGPLGTGCQHGIGHGLVEYLGPSKLADALSYCLTTQRLLLLGCTSGAFMEYNFPTQTGDRTAITTVRTVDKANPFTPCDSVDDKFKPSCYFEISQWWYQAYEKDSKAMGALCQNLARSSDRDYCFRGLGATIGHRLSYNLDQSLSECRQISSTEGVVLCQAGVSWSFYAEPTKREESYRPCQDLSAQNKQICLEKADLLKDVF